MLWIKRILLTYILLFLIASIALYLPFVQEMATKSLEQLAGEASGYTIAVNRLRLRFPLTLELQQTMATQSTGDTLFRAERVGAELKLLPLIRLKLEIRSVNLEGVALHYRDSMESFALDGKLERLRLKGYEVDLKKEEVDMGQTLLRNGSFTFTLLKVTPPDSIPTPPIAWKFYSNRLLLRDISFRFDDRTTGFITDISLSEGSARRGAIDLMKQRVDFDLLRLQRGDYRILLPASAESTTDEALSASLPTTPTLPWEVQLGRLIVESNRFEMHQGAWSADSGRFDPNHLFVEEINFRADSIQNRGVVTSLRLSDVAFALTPHLRFSNGGGRVHYEEGVVGIEEFSLKSEQSSLSLTTHLNWHMEQEQLSIDQLIAELELSLHPYELQLLLGESVERAAANRNKSDLTASLALYGEDNRVVIERLTASYPQLFTLRSSGWVKDPTNFDHLSANLKLTLLSQRGELLEELLPKSLAGRLRLPDNLQLSGDLQANRGQITPRFDLLSPAGSLHLAGKAHLKQQSYEATIEVDSLALNHFLPKDSLGILDATLTVKGVGFDPLHPKTAFELVGAVNRFDYLSYAYRNLSLQGKLQAGELNAELLSENRPLNLQANLGGRLDPNGVELNLDFNLKNLDLQELHLSQTPLSTAFSGDFHLNHNLKQQFKGMGQLTIPRLILLDKLYEPGSVEMMATNGDSSLLVTLRSGDLHLKLQASTSLEAVLNSFGHLSSLILTKKEPVGLNFADLRAALPPLEMTLTGGKNNLLNNFLKQQEQLIESFSLRATTSVNEGVRLESTLLGLQNKSSLLDTLTVTMIQDSNRINFEGRMINRPNHPYAPMRIHANGWLENSDAEVRMLQTNYDGRVGFDLGVRAHVEREKLTLRFFPEAPIIGFAPWQLNSDNYITLDQEMRIDGNLQLIGEVAKFRLTPVISEADGDQVVALDIDGIDLSKISAYIPYFPAMEGAVASNFLLSSNKEGLSTSGSFGIGEFLYEQQRIGDLKVVVNYVTGADKKQTLLTSLLIDNQEAAILEGDLGSDGEMRISLPNFPLNTLNPFIPPGMAELNGRLRGSLTMRQQGAMPIINGSFAFEKTEMNLLPISTTFSLDSQRVVIEQSRLRFADYKLYSGKNPPLRLNGSVDFRNTDYIFSDLRVDGNNFQLLDAPRLKGAMVYGKAFIDLTTQIQGTPQKMAIRGSLNLLNQTDLTYVMQDLGVSVSNKTDELVRFVSFADTAALHFDKKEKVKELEGMDLLFTVNVAPAVRLGINLSESGNDRVELEGGGTLSYLMNREGVNSMTGRYNLTGGNVRYDLPVIGEKVFKVAEGSRVEWNGDLLNPILNLTAKERIRASVTDEGNNSRSVNFDAIVRITQPLSQMAINFDLDSPEDLTIQNRLISLTAEERSKEAMNLILYGSYNLAGFNTKSASTSALQGFVEKQMNQWARNSLKGVDLNFGIDNMDQASAGTRRTDYTVEFSKRLFNDRFKINVGGRVSTGDDPSVKQDQTFIDDLSLEYALDKKQYLFAKLFYHTGFDNVLEGRITKTGFAITLKRKLYRLKNLFKFRNTKSNDAKPTNTNSPTR